MLNTVGACGAGEKDFLKAIAVFYLVIELGPDQPHPAAGRIGFKPEFPVGRTIKISIIAGEFAVTAPEAPVNNIGVFHL